MSLKLSVILNVLFYIVIGVLTFRMMMKSHENEKTVDDPHYRKFAIVMSIIWPFMFFIIAIDGEDHKDFPM